MKDIKRKALEELSQGYKRRKLTLRDRLPHLGQTTKSQALAHYIAKRDKKELPVIKPKKRKDDKYKKLTISEFEKIYQ